MLSTIDKREMVTYPGAVLQVRQVISETAAAFSTTSGTLQLVSPLASSLTPVSTNSKVLVEVTMVVGKYGWYAGSCSFGLARNGSTVFGPRNSIEHYGADEPNSGWDGSVVINYSYIDSPNTSSSVTYTPMLAANSAYSIVLNSVPANTAQQRGVSYMTLTEIAG